MTLRDTSAMFYRLSHEQVKREFNLYALYEENAICNCFSYFKTSRITFTSILYPQWIYIYIYIYILDAPLQNFARGKYSLSLLFTFNTIIVRTPPSLSVTFKLKSW